MDTPNANRPELWLEREEGFRFRVRFCDARIRDLVTDEPSPVGRGAGPNPAALLGAAVANCLASSLVYCLEKAHLGVEHLDAEVWITTAPNAEGRRRIPSIQVRLMPVVTLETQQRMGRCLEIYESFCLVTGSVREGIDVRVDLEPQMAQDREPCCEPAEARGA